MNFLKDEYRDLASGVATHIKGLGTRALGNLSYPFDIEEPERYNDVTYLRKLAIKSFIIVGELADVEDGTTNAAHGNFFQAYPLEPNVTDKERIRDVYALRLPGDKYKPLQHIFRKQVAALNDTRLRMCGSEEWESKMIVTEEWTHPTSDPDAHGGEIIRVHSKPKFKNPRDVLDTNHAQRIMRAPFLDDMKNNFAPVRSLDLQVGKSYPVEVLPDFNRHTFKLSSAKVVQQDITDVRGHLIPPWQNRTRLRPGRLLMIDATPTCQIMETDYGPTQVLSRVNKSF